MSEWTLLLDRGARARRGGLPPTFDTGRWQQRNTIERCFSKLRQFRAVATRYDKRALAYQGTEGVASIRIWLPDPPHDLQDTAGRREPVGGWLET
jgi:transposase